MELKQVHPNPSLDPGFRLGLDGRCRFRHEGLQVDIHVRRLTDQDKPWYREDESGPDDVLVIGTVTECGVELARVEWPSDFSDPYVLREAVERTVSEAADKGRAKVAALVERLAAIDRRRPAAS
ncbi:hypothetical protein [Streptomyces sp. P17]|uniref:hypothetical protein n=1 Tax=Streptomyces sp. P17 TaxID=3074716 RepID=UPI0028F44E53|nr:hypothetical protein [Streptomyces sp. P17]MDT9700140.1 hypothetical protein [Streptomyces sp. P17]